MALTKAELKNMLSGMDEKTVRACILAHGTTMQTDSGPQYKVRELILDKEDRLQMGDWHGDDKWVDRTCIEEAECGTSHCLAGWLQVCAIDPKVRSLSAELAGIVQARVATKMFFRSNEETLDWLKDRKYADELKAQL